ncbi:hypothetical protein WH47_11380 [Habropoda laboriosa]|uniref:Uncharacterized protein n=1 Tax=Habropoda laboriosa TaxID=597456 RepID=A0A0L7R9T6_9HYME|nr:PREDICTED: uncharacterized protein LOC108570217 [Habropoda laboriosa]KOC67632.1 hypothetical protein WH47_11380 [Habropoda laboriosa]
MPDINEIINSIGNDDSQDEKQRDREIRGRRGKSNDRYKIIKNEQLWKIKFAKYLINDLKNYGPTGLIHMNALSILTGKPIRIWKPDGRLCQTINNGTSDSLIGHTINVEYHKQAPNCIGHWTLLGNKDPVDAETDLNMCLFTVIAAQTGKSAIDLRTDTIDFLTNNTKHLIAQIDTFLSSNGNNNKTSLMIGGARYIGTSPKAAGVVLDNSQNVYCRGCRAPGHPRGHASDANATGVYDSVENYSRLTGSMKSGFLSRTDQNNVAHLVLKHEKTQQAMRDLNEGMSSVAVKLSRRQLNTDGHALPKMKECYNGEMLFENLDIFQITIVLRHHQGKYMDPNADVLVHTFYPNNKVY